MITIVQLGLTLGIIYWVVRILYAVFMYLKISLLE